MSSPPRWVPPPSWPAPPPGWLPPPGWEPDAAWGPAPDGWSFWQPDLFAAPVRKRSKGKLVGLSLAGLLLFGGCVSALGDQDGSGAAPTALVERTADEGKTDDAADRAAAEKAAAERAAAEEAAEEAAEKAAAEKAAAEKAAADKAAAEKAAADKAAAEAAAEPQAFAAPAGGASYANCTELRVDYPGGVARPGAVDKRSGGGQARYAPKYDAALYDRNSGKDRDDDGIACEQ